MSPTIEERRPLGRGFDPELRPDTSAPPFFGSDAPPSPTPDAGVLGAALIVGVVLIGAFFMNQKASRGS